MKIQRHLYLKVNEFKIRNSTNDPKLMNSLIIPNEATDATGTKT